MPKINDIQLQKRRVLEQELGNIPCVPEKTRCVFARSWFKNRYFMMREIFKTDFEAYECLEKHYQRVTGRRRYKNFEVFRRVLCRK